MNELSRPMLDSDVDVIASSVWAERIRRMVAEYGREFLPVMNGSFAYSNLREGPGQILTCSPYRLWEYASLFLLHDQETPWRRALDVGGAASPLPYFLAECGIPTTAVDLQPLLVGVCNHVAGVRALPLHAAVEDVTRDSGEDRSYDLVTFISVLEHIDVTARETVLRAIFRRLQPGGLFYLTFDYGQYVEKDPYRSAAGEALHRASSIDDIHELCAVVERCGFEFAGNDPRLLPPEILRQVQAPRARSVMDRQAANAGVFDSATPWLTIAKYLFRRTFRVAGRRQASRYDHHNFFRMFLRRPI